MSEQPRPLEQILAAAAADPSLKEALLADRLAAVEARGLKLSPSEQKILLAVPDEQLHAMVDRLVVGAPPAVAPLNFAPQGIRPEAPAGVRPSNPTRGIRPDSPVKGTRPGRLLLTAAAATVVTAGAASLCVTAGVRPDTPPPVTEAAQPRDNAEERADARPPADAGLPTDPERPTPPHKR